MYLHRQLTRTCICMHTKFHTYMHTYMHEFSHPFLHVHTQAREKAQQERAALAARLFQQQQVHAARDAARIEAERRVLLSPLYNQTLGTSVSSCYVKCRVLLSTPCFGNEPVNFRRWIYSLVVCVCDRFSAWCCANSTHVDHHLLKTSRCIVAFFNFSMY